MSRGKKVLGDMPLLVPPPGPVGSGYGPEAEWRAYIPIYCGEPSEQDLLDRDDIPRDAALDIMRWVIFGPAATHLEYWKSCRFSVCRRHHACRAKRLDIREVGEHWGMKLPCCFKSDEKHQRLIAYLNDYLERYPDDPDDPKEIEEWLLRPENGPPNGRK